MARFARTVLGDVETQALGATYCHEHLFTSPRADVIEQDQDLVLDDPHRAAAELRAFRSAGGGALVEVTTPEFGRCPEGLRELSRRVGVHIVATTGHVSEEYWKGVLPLDETTEDALVAELLRDLTDGMVESGPRSGMIKVGSSKNQVTETERKIMRAAATVQRETGAPITTHTTAGTAALEQIDALDEAGADLSHVCIGHLDRLLDWDYHLRIARRGVFLGYDCISKEHYQPDARRIEFIVRLFEAGYGRRICLSGDLARRGYLEAWGGGPGYRYILERFIPRLQKAGLNDEAVHDLLVDNPARLLAWQ
jgi:predicted metal-dependent phosphotriesterase family hydrolase